MKIRTQFIVSMATFSVLLLIVAASIVLTNQQIVLLNEKWVISASIDHEANQLNIILSQYFLYQQPQLLAFWESNITSISSNLSNLNPTTTEQQTLVSTTINDLNQLNSSFTNLVSFLETAPRNVSVRIIPEFQNDWNQTVSQHEVLGLDTSRLEESLRIQANQLRETNIELIIGLLGVFGAFLLTMYLVTYRHTLKSISKLQAGINTIGSGNLDYSINVQSNDEVGNLSQAFNAMAANLKTATASKKDLEQEIVARNQAEIALRESEQRWATTLASIGDAVIATDTLGNIMFLNGVAEEQTGWALSEALQKPVKTVFNIVNEQTHLEVESPVDQVLREGMVVGLANHTVLIRKDGTEVPIEDSGAPIRDKDGKTVGVVLVFRDISERKKVEDELLDSAARLNRSQEIAHLGSWELDLVKDKLSWSDEVYRIFGLKPQEFTPTYEAFLQAIHPDDREAVDAAYSGSLRESRDTYEIEHRVVRKTTCEIRIVYEKAEHLRNGHGKIVRSIGMVQDITDRKMMEAKLEEYNKHLENLVEERTKALKDAERLAAIGATAGMVGHDIRNPLQAITSDVYLAKTELSSLPESNEKKAIQESLQEIEKNIDYINKIVADLQDFARPLNPHADETDLNRVIDDLLTKNGLPENVKVDVKVESAARNIVTDSTYIQRILCNLVNNAVQAMPKGGKLTIQAYKEAKYVVIAVKDTGVGISEDVKGKLFTPMFTTKSKGQGFGLPVIKRLTEALGGTVTFESQQGNGTTFKVRLPLHLKVKKQKI